MQDDKGYSIIAALVRGFGNAKWRYNGITSGWGMGSVVLDRAGVLFAVAEENHLDGNVISASRVSVYGAFFPSELET